GRSKPGYGGGGAPDDTGRPHRQQPPLPLGGIPPGGCAGSASWPLPATALRPRAPPRPPRRSPGPGPPTAARPGTPPPPAADQPSAPPFRGWRSPFQGPSRSWTPSTALRSGTPPAATTPCPPTWRRPRPATRPAAARPRRTPPRSEPPHGPRAGRPQLRPPRTEPKPPADPAHYRPQRRTCSDSTDGVRQ